MFSEIPHNSSSLIVSVSLFAIHFIMASSNATAAQISALVYSSTIFTRTWCFTMFALGTVGHTLSVYIFTRPTLYSNPCARYFLASAISGYAVVFMSIPVRLLQAGYTLNVVTYSEMACKILTFLLFWARYEDRHTYRIRFSSISS